MLNWLEQTLRDLRFAARGLRRTPWFTAMAVLSLAIGIMATTAIYSVLYGVVLESVPLQGRRPVDERPGVEPGAARLPDRLFRRSVPRDGRAQHDLRGHDCFDDQRRAVDGRGRSAAAARQLRHLQHLRRDGRAAADRADAGGGRCPARRAAGGRARLPVLAAAVRRRSGGAGPIAAAERHHAHGHRRDAEAVHVARRRCLRAGRLHARPGDGRCAFGPSARPPEAGVTEAQAEADLRPIIEELRKREPTQFPEQWRVGLLSFADTFPSGITRRHLGAVRRRGAAAADCLRQRVEPVVVARHRPATGDDCARGPRRQPVPAGAAAARREPAARVACGGARHCARLCRPAGHPGAGAARHDSGRVRGRAQRIGAAVHPRHRRVDQHHVRSGAGAAQLRSQPREPLAGSRERRGRNDTPGQPAQGHGRRRSGAGADAAGRRQPAGAHVRRDAARRSRVFRRPAADAASAPAGPPLS